MTYQQKLAQVQAQLQGENVESMSLHKSTSYIFRKRHDQTQAKLDLSDFNGVIFIDPDEMTADVEGLITFYDLAQETLKYNMLPKVVPELRSITVGGAISGLAIEASSFKYGLFHESVLEMDILLSNGVVVTASEHEYSDLFMAIPNSYGSLGYILRARLELVPVKPYVKLTREFFSDGWEYFERIAEVTHPSHEHDFIDGTIFAKDDFVLTMGQMVDEVPREPTNYLWNVYYLNLKKPEDYVTIWEFLWRYDRDSFWSTMHAPVLQNYWVRRLVGKYVLRSDRLRKMGRFIRQILRMFKRKKNSTTHYESIIQDIGIPCHNCSEFVTWLDQEIGIYPMFVCPTKSEKECLLWDLHDGELSCDIGIFDSKRSEHAPGYYNKMIEDKLPEFEGKKSLYSSVYYDQETFDQLYTGPEYYKLKGKYDSTNKFPTLFQKCVGQ